MTWLSVLQNLNLLLIYVVPGYMAIAVKSLLLPTRKKELYSFFFESVILSYIILGLVEGLRQLYYAAIKNTELYQQLNLSSISTGFLLILIGIIFGTIMAIISKSDWLYKIFRKIGVNINHYPTLWNEKLDKNNEDYKNNDFPPFVRVYLESERVIYDGFVESFTSDPNYEEKEIYLIGYRCFSYDDQICLEDNYGNWSAGILLKNAKMSRIEFLELKSNQI